MSSVAHGMEVPTGTSDDEVRLERRPGRGFLEHPVVEWLRLWGPYVLGAALLALAVWLMHDVLAHFRYQDLARELSALGWWRIALAIAFTFLSFAALAGYEHFALVFAGRRLSFERVAIGSFVAQSIAHSTGFALVVATSLRYQLYARWGLDVTDVAKVQAFFSATFGIGVATLVGAALVLEPHFLDAVLPLPVAALRGLGLLILGVVGAYLLWSRYAHRPFTVFGHTIAPPRAGETLVQIALAALDLGAAAAALWVLLPAEPAAGYLQLLGMYVLAIIIGVASHVPGSLGVFEGAMLLQLRPTEAETIPVLGALLVFRAVYYLLPMLLGAVILAISEFARLRHVLGTVGERTARWIGPLVPNVAAGLALLAGGVLLFSGATPAAAGRLSLLHEIVPTPVIEISHFLSSIVGTGLLLVARPLQRRAAGGWTIAVGMLTAGIVLSILKGLDVEEASLLLLTLLVLLPCRVEFFRPSRLLDERLSPGWWIGVAVILLTALWLMFFAFKHVEYSNDLWWRVELRAEAPRALRAALGAVVLLGAAGFLHLMRAPPANPHPATPEELATARRIIEACGTASARLALTGDKAFHFDATRTAFVMYGVSGRSWIAMGAPVGPVERWGELLWDFHEAADAHGALTVFYEVGPDHLPLFLDLGLHVVKIGERARVLLPAFELKGKRRTDLRTAINRAGRTGTTFEVVPPAAVPPIVDELAAVSDAWLADHKTREKRFSLGFFSPDYLASGPVAVVRREGRVIAFANLWISADKEDCSIDLMRFTATAGPGTMDFLMASVMLWAKGEGYRWFDLGMAPLSGLPDHHLASLWARVGRLMVRHGAQFYNFAGLRAFKEKFDPVWQPAYLLYPPRRLPRALADVTALISGGWTGIVRK